MAKDEACRKVQEGKVDRRAPRCARAPGVLARAAFGAACAIMFGAAPAAPATLRDPGDLAAIKSRGELVIVTRNSPTTTFIGRSGQTVGFEHDLATAFAHDLGVKPRFIEVDSVEAMLDDLDRGEADLAAGSITKTAKLEKQFRFGPTYAHVYQELVCNPGHKPTTVSALAKVRTVVVPADTSHATRLPELRRKYPHVDLHWRVVKGASTEQLLEEVAEGLADCTVTDSNVFAINRSYHPRLEVMLKLSSPQPLAWPMPKRAHALADAATHWLAKFKKDGKLTKLKARYFKFLKPRTFVDKQTLAERVRKIYPRYAADFAQAASQYDLNPWLLAAQAYEESHWDADAEGPNGARGMMMLTQPTARKVHAPSRLSPAENIMGGAKYMRLIEDRFPAAVKPPDRHYLALAAYNIGYVHVADAMQLAKRLGGNPDLWTDVAKTLPLLTEPRYYETLKHGYAPGIRAVQYVHRIRGDADIIRHAMVSPNRHPPRADQRHHAGAAPPTRACPESRVNEREWTCGPQRGWSQRRNAPPATPSVVRQRVDDRTPQRAGVGVASTDQFVECALQGGEVANLACEQLPVALGKRAGRGAGVRPVEGQQGRDFVEREPERLGALDEAHAPDSIGGITPLAAEGPGRLGQQAAALVVPDGLDIDAGGLGEPADRKRSGHRWNLTPYPGTECRIAPESWRARRCTPMLRNVPAFPATSRAVSRDGGCGACRSRCWSPTARCGKAAPGTCGWPWSRSPSWAQVAWSTSGAADAPTAT